LLQAQEWRTRHETELNPLEREFLDASIALKQRLEQRERDLEQGEREQKQRELEAAQKLAETERRRAEEQSRRDGGNVTDLRTCGLLLATGFIATVALKQRAAAQEATRIAEDKTRAALAAEKKTAKSPAGEMFRSRCIQ